LTGQKNIAYNKVDSGKQCWLKERGDTMKKRIPYALVRLKKYTYLLHLLGIFSDEEKKEILQKLNSGQKGSSR
jgi:hypothetical protein